MTQLLRLTRIEEEAHGLQEELGPLHFPFHVVLEALAEAASGKFGGFDQIVDEMCKVRLAEQFHL